MERNARRTHLAFLQGALIVAASGCDTRGGATDTPTRGADAQATDASSDGAVIPSSAVSAVHAQATSEVDAGPDEPFRGSNNHAILNGAPIPNRSEDNAKLRREIRATIAPPTKAFIVGKAFSLRDTTGPREAKRVDGKTVTDVIIVVTLTNASATAQCNIRVFGKLLDAKGTAIGGVILPEQDLVGDIGGFRNDPSKMAVLGAGPGVYLHDNCLAPAASGYAIFAGNLPSAPFENVASIEMSVDTWNGAPPPLVGPKAKMLPVDYAYEPDPTNHVTISVRNAGTAAAAVKSVRYLMLDARGDVLFAGWTRPTAADPANPLATVKVAPGETIKSDDAAANHAHLKYQGHGGTRMVAWVDFADAR